MGSRWQMKRRVLEVAMECKESARAGFDLPESGWNAFTEKWMKSGLVKSVENGTFQSCHICIYCFMNRALDAAEGSGSTGLVFQTGA